VTREPSHIAGHADAITPRQRELVDLAARLGRANFAPRAARHDREASFPLENFADLRAAGLLGLTVPQPHGGLGADYETYALVCAELGRHCASTALSFGMHATACMWAGFAADALDLTPAERADHERCRARHFAGIVQQGLVYALPFSEGGAATAGKAPWSTMARRVDGGYLVHGRKIFVSLAGAAQRYAVLCTLDHPGATPRDTLFLAVAADAQGVSVTGEWDPMGMRATVSRSIVFDHVFVADDARLLPEGAAWPAAQRWPHLHAALQPTYVGIAQAAYDFTVQYLRGEVPGMAPVRRRMYPTKQLAVAKMRVLLEALRAQFLACAREAHVDPGPDARARLLAAHYSVMENASAVCSLALRTCGGQAMQRSLPLERLYRDARCGSLMLPLSAELCLDHLGREALYDAGELDEEIEP
jgi:alkylation response protein AidB-like acyl-CoA dehydrogenase